ncbi:DUF4097 family beta strand repeat-containing protein [Synoicihabitans lomoniglobus]|uniref:DUF4097 family beta strand repeat-containing protein n=1 Tax=Synoicihabitans lomoniglobus TaxID=2909285 RepID=A0AAF0I258_9BACT|nr:DUF4097 domain-containing protein [Opitutaceae bacterium LMO-M01]WED66282.1 DUF4097 family beta strand repeat-containing protein [Opitutaceae bacterium LMO-M01]
MLRKILLPLLALAVPTLLTAKITREVEKSFRVGDDAAIEVDISGGSIDVEIGSDDQFHVTLQQTFRTNSESEADEILERYDVTLDQSGDRVRVIVRSDKKSGGWFSGWRNRGANFSVKLIAPAHADLNLDTSGGSIRVDGDSRGEIIADTSGGSISVDGSAGHMNLDTSGGSIRVGYALSRLRADTSGGSITIGYVGPDADDINADTSGGSITIGLDPAGGYDLLADTSGGSVHINGLSFRAEKKTRTHAEGEINGGGARVRADTSGGGITIKAADR